MAVDFVFESHVPEVKELVDKALEKAFTIIGLEAERYAKYLCPVDTGRLRNSITYATRSHKNYEYKYDYDLKTGEGRIKNGASGVTKVGDVEDEPAVYLGTNVKYAPYVEFGTKRTKAQPFLKPAIQDHIPKYENIIQTELQNIT